ncbi:hypothetical protein OS11_19120 [Dickeya oryzae]
MLYLVDNRCEQIVQRAGAAMKTAQSVKAVKHADVKPTQADFLCDIVQRLNVRGGMRFLSLQCVPTQVRS